MAATLSISSTFASPVFAQGWVHFGNGVGLEVSTNATALRGGTGPTATTMADFYYGLFLAPPSVTNIDINLQNLLNGGIWTFTGVYATNTAKAGQLYSSSLAIPGWPPGYTNTYLVAGWSSNLGHDWSTISNQLIGAVFVNGNLWTNGAWAASGFFGASLNRAGGGGLPFAASTDPLSTMPPFALFGTSETADGAPASGFSLFSTAPAPEPSTLALSSLGALALLSFKRRCCTPPYHRNTRRALFQPPSAIPLTYSCG